MYKILKGIDRLESSQFFSLADTSNTRGHSLKLMKGRSRSSLKVTVFNQRVPTVLHSNPDLTNIGLGSVTICREVISKQYFTEKTRLDRSF